ncbi:lytic transglycosylase domain-containing protein [uncultured Tepidimonas sp.]|uniref:lytic transglycosylase domain-containing protein n=1 Tax=uncultured Tepidimonas sp. TaxID=453579 RepID=UPI002633C8AE|nr:lytic transglycosylase domain-containing protein [uncultured Tepidimonas sp.]
MAFASALPTSPPAWTDEPPQLSRWIEAGWQSEQAHDPALAAAWYCRAARHGSAQAYHRLGMLLGAFSLDEVGQAAGVASLRQAAQLGYADALADLERALAQRPDARGGDPGDLPECLRGGEPPSLTIATAAPAVAVPSVVPHEVVAHYVANLPADKRRHALMIQRLAPQFAVDGRLALAIARAESNFEPRAVSPRNAQGLMQLIPSTAERFGVRNAFDPEQNVRGGLSYLRWLLERFDGDVALVSAAYNAGEGVVDRFGGVPPYAETRAYVQRILNFYRASRHAAPGRD